MSKFEEEVFEKTQMSFVGFLASDVKIGQVILNESNNLNVGRFNLSSFLTYDQEYRLSTELYEVGELEGIWSKNVDYDVHSSANSKLVEILCQNVIRKVKAQGSAKKNRHIIMSFSKVAMKSSSYDCLHKLLASATFKKNSPLTRGRKLYMIVAIGMAKEIRIRVKDTSGYGGEIDLSSDIGDAGLSAQRLDRHGADWLLSFKTPRPFGVKLWQLTPSLIGEGCNYKAASGPISVMGGGANSRTDSNESWPLWVDISHTITQ
ncbi:hypothetical protein [Thalassospira tepidiphila]|uniref:hypothetical protein n=1 Tax=Thalassospira tepidiphila TaxID=393657 RepID=UPI00292135E0|nr:hypothetical protein MACH01_17830 [Thalassospira tepidiphila]